MTDQELIEAVQATPAEELSLEQIEALHNGLLRSPALRDALVERLQMEEYLGHALGRIEVSVDRILQQAQTTPTGSSTARLLYWGLALLLLVSAGVGYYVTQRRVPPAEQVVQAAPPQPPIAPKPEDAPASADAQQKLTDASQPNASQPATTPQQLPAQTPTEIAAAAGVLEPWKLVIEAEDFSRGDATADERDLGRHIGVIRGRANRAVFAEYDIQVPKAGSYQLELRYAAEEAAPLTLSVNDKPVRSGVAGEVTGGWSPESQRWFNEGMLTLREGKNTLRLSSQESMQRRRHTFPALDQLKLVAVARPAVVIDAALAATQPWHEVLAAQDPPPAFSEVCFDDFAHADALRSAELSAWLEQPPGQQMKIREQLPACIFDGVARLRSPWQEELSLRLGLWDHHGLKIHFWNGRQGVSLWYYQYPPTWVAYQTTRENNQPAPKTFALAAQDEQRFSRTSHGAFELRWTDGRIWMTRGDLPLLSAALAEPPAEVYLEGHAGIRGIQLVRSRGLPPWPAARPVVLASEQPGTLSWQSELPDGARIAPQADGSLELTAQKTKEVSRVALSYPTEGFYEVIFQIDDPQPGTGVFLGDEQGKIQHKVAFMRDSRSGQTSLSFLAPADKRLESSEDISQRPASYALKRHWIKLILGCGTVKNYVSDDGVHFSRGDSPIQTPTGIKPCSTLGIYCHPTDDSRRIRLRSIAVRELPALSRLLPDELEDQALALTGDGNWTLGDWLAQVVDNQPADVDPTTWRRACAAKTLRAGPATTLGVALLLGLADEVLKDPAPLTERLELLDEVCLLAPTWNYDSRQLGVELARRYEALGQRISDAGEARPYTVISHALLATPIASASAIPTFPETLLRQELLNLVQAERWEEALDVCRRAEYWNRPVAPGQRMFARESLAGLVEWTHATATRRAAERPSSGVAALRSEWRHPLVEVLSKEGYNILAEFNAALDGEAYQDACQIISSADPQGALGLLPDVKDSRLLVSLPAAVSLAMREHPLLRQTMNEQFGARGQLRVRQAIGEGNLMALEAATMQFCGTEAAAEAHLWLGDRALAAGDFLHAMGQYRQALEGNLPAGAVQPRMRLAAAMLGREEGQPASQSVRLNDIDLKAEDFETLVAEMLARSDGQGAVMMAAANDASDAEIIAPRPAGYETSRWAEFNGDLGRDAQQSPYPAIDFAGQQLASMVSNDLLLVNNRFQVVAYELKTGKQRWSTRLDKQQGYAHSWPLMPMRMVVNGGRVYTRRLSSRGPELVCLQLDDGKLIWSARPGDHVAADPLVAQDQLLAITAAGTQDSYLQLSLAAFDPRNGELLFQRPLVQLRDVWNRQVPCQATSVDDRIIAYVGGGVLCCDLLGQVHWLRRQLWLPKALDDNWEQQFVQPPLIDGDLTFVMQPGVRSIECLETATGRMRWQEVLPEIRRLCGVVQERLVVATAKGLKAFHAQDGAAAWNREAQLLTAQACGEPGGVLFVESEQIDKESWRPTLVWLDAITGREAGRAALHTLVDKQPLVGPLVVHEDRLWTFFGRGGREAAREIYELLPKRPASPGAGIAGGLDAWPLSIDGSLKFATAALPGWRLLSGSVDSNTRWHAELRNQADVLVTLATEKRPARFVRLLDLPAGTRGRLVLKVGHEPDRAWGLDVRVGANSLASQTVDASFASDGWKQWEIDLSPYAGRREWITVMHRAVGDKPSYAAWHRLDVITDPPPAPAPPHGGE